MRVLLIGSGGREHALAWKLAQSPRLTQLFTAPGNAGTAEHGRNVDLDVADHAAVVAFAAREGIELAIIGPDAPAVAGLADDLRAAGILTFGPSKAAAQLEGSKSFTKALCDEMGIPTAAYASFNEEAPALEYLRRRGAPIVVKADGLAAGKGVTVAATLEEAEAGVRDCFAGAFGASGAQVVIEECLVGEEVSLFAVSDGERFILLPSAQDHKRAFDGDTGPNTGGMGAYSPAPVLTPALLARARDEIIAPALRGMGARGTPFQGVLFAGLMLTAEGPKLIEFNVRFGDPECQVLMLRLKSDLIDLLEAAALGDVSRIAPQWRDEAALTVVMAARGYPGHFERGSEIAGLAGLDAGDLKIFQAGTRREGHRILANGGRVLNVTALGPTISAARDRAYAGLRQIYWPQGFCRNDIGARGIAHERGLNTL